MKINPFSVPLGDKVDFLHSMTAAALKNDEIAFAVANLFCRKRESIYRNSLSGGCSQTLVSTYPNCGITVFNEETRAIDSRTTRLEPQAAGWEVTSMDFVDEVRQAVLDILQYKRSPLLEEGDYEIIFDPTHLWRVLLDTLVTFIDPYTMNGLDASNPSKRFIAPKDMGRRIIGSKQFGLRFDNTVSHGLASTGWDDAGFPADAHKVVTEGRLDKIPVSDDLKAVSQGVNGSVNRAQGHMAIRFAMPNVIMDSPADAPTAEKMIADTKNGLFVSGRTRTMLSPGRTGFQSQGQIVRRIRNGVLSDMVRDVVYECKLSDFWKRLVQTGSEKEMFLGGDLNPQRIQPHWDTPFSIGTVPARFKNIRAYSISKGNAK
jgi:TldD protein